MKLDKTLNFKKVRCVKAYDDCLKIGKEYDVIDVSVEIKVKDDEGDLLYWDSDHFDPVLGAAENPPQEMKLTPEFETEASETKFKAGDKVYCLLLDPKIFTILEVGGDNDNDVQFAGEVGWASGYSCCHANQENYERLQAIFPRIEFERPPKPLSGDDIVKAMLKKGIKNVLCLWGNGDKIIIDRLSYKGGLMSVNCNIVGGLTPIDWYTGEPLTESILDD